MLKNNLLKNLFISLFVSALLFSPLSGNERKKNYTDGPHVTWIDGSRVVSVVVKTVDGKRVVEKKVLKAEDFPAYSKTLPHPELNYYLEKPEVEKSSFKAERIIAIGDIHGCFVNFTKLLINNRITDKKLNWISGKTHLVLPGDIMDKGHRSTECYWLVRKLEKQAAKAGGKVHFLLGNHEYMVTQGDLRYIGKKYKKLHRYRFNKLYSKRTELGRWLRTKNVLIKINDLLFSHAGISPELAGTGLSIEKINSLFRELIDLDFTYNEPDGKREKLFTLLAKSKGPIWYRGFYKEDVVSQEQFDSVIKQYGAERMILGHTKQKTITSYFKGKLLAIDAMDNYKPEVPGGEVLLIEKGKYNRLTIDGKKEELKL